MHFGTDFCISSSGTIWIGSFLKLDTSFISHRTQTI
jgi:hypothetical protein